MQDKTRTLTRAVAANDQVLFMPGLLEGKIMRCLAQGELRWGDTDSALL